MLDLLTSNFRFIAQDYVAWAICIAALIWGGGPERAVALTWLLLFEVADAIYHAVFDQGYSLTEVDLFHAGLDGTACMIMFLIALNANRNFTMGIAAMQLLAVTAHLTRGLVESVSPVAYITMVVGPGWFQLILLAVGLTRHSFRKRKYGPYRDWRNSQSPLSFTASSVGPGLSSGAFGNTRASWRDHLK